jgi:DNA polymerase III subunit gamma/tau
MLPPPNPLESSLEIPGGISKIQSKMSYQVIARKYRPQRFSDVVGQDHVTQTLVNAIQQNRIAHAYLFVGPRGTGKTTLARIFAKCLNCTGGPKVDFDENDPRAQEITEGRSLDVFEIDGASNRGIEEIRELRETVKYAPASSRFKIYIIDEVHMLTKEAFNALLKTLEEPPEHVKFMFATTEPDKVLPTILSRCQRFDLRRITAALIIKHLAHIARLEKVNIDDEALHAIARGADGGMRDAESALDQLISFCGGSVSEQDVLSMFGLAARSQIFALSRAVLDGQIEAVLRELDSLSRSGKDLGRLLSDLLTHFRNLLLFHISNGDLSLLEVPEAEANVLAEQSTITSTDSLTRMMDVLTEYEGRLREAASRRILVEVALLKTIQARNAVGIDTILQKLQALRSQSSHSPDAPIAPPIAARSGSFQGTAAMPVSTAAAHAVQPEQGRGLQPSTPGASHEAASSLADLWSRVVEAVGRASPFTKSYLLEAHPVSFANGLFIIGFDPAFADHLSLVDNPKNRGLIQTKLQELGCSEAQVKFIQAKTPEGFRPPASRADTAPPAEDASPVSAAQAPQAEPATRPASKEDFRNDPLIKQALEIFKGQIVEISA